MDKIKEINIDLCKIDDYVEFNKITLNIKFSHLIIELNRKIREINHIIEKLIK